MILAIGREEIHAEDVPDNEGFPVPQHYDIYVQLLSTKYLYLYLL
jgi:hypothetical protein